MVKIFNEEIQRRRQERRNEKTSGWPNIIFKILLFLAVLWLIRMFGSAYFEDIKSFFF